MHCLFLKHLVIKLQRIILQYFIFRFTNFYCKFYYYFFILHWKSYRISFTNGSRLFCWEGFWIMHIYVYITLIKNNWDMCRSQVALYEQRITIKAVYKSYVGRVNLPSFYSLFSRRLKSAFLINFFPSPLSSSSLSKSFYIFIIIILSRTTGPISTGVQSYNRNK